MFSFVNPPRPRYPSIRQALLRAGIANAGEPTRVAVFEKHGNYSGRRVTFFRAFVPDRQDVVIASGHVECKGTVIVNRLPDVQSVATSRQPATRADHTDDQRLVFWDADAARRSEVALSTPAATWLQARSTVEPQ